MQGVGAEFLDHGLCLCSTMSGASSGKTQMAMGDSSGRGWIVWGCLHSPGAWLGDWAQWGLLQGTDMWPLWLGVLTGVGLLLLRLGHQGWVFPQGRSCPAFCALASAITWLSTFLWDEDHPGSSGAVIDTRHLVVESQRMCVTFYPRG